MSDSGHDPLFLATGRALHAWSLVEVQMSVLFSIMAGVKGGTGIGILSTVHSADVRIEMCDRVARLKHNILVPELRDIWDVLVKRLYSANRQRNELAHFSVVETEKGARLVPFFSLAGNLEEKPSLSVHDIEQRARCFNALAEVLCWAWTVQSGDQALIQQGLGKEPSMLQEIRGVVAQRKATSSPSEPTGRR